MFYHEFLIFTVATNDMYDRMFAFNINLDRWIWSEDSTPANFCCPPILTVSTVHCFQCATLSNPENIVDSLSE